MGVVVVVVIYNLLLLFTIIVDYCLFMSPLDFISTMVIVLCFRSLLHFLLLCHQQESKGIVTSMSM